MIKDELQRLEESDLVNYANRGTLKRATKELAEGLSVECHEFDSGITFVWSDGVTCEFPNDQPLMAASCTCKASRECRHIVRSILHLKASAEHLSEAEGPWNPGELSDDALIAAVGGEVFNRAKAALASGMVAELFHGQRPEATLLTLGRTVRFSLPDKLEHAQCDCSTPRCFHIPLAAMMFRFSEALDYALVTNDRETPLSAEEAAPLIDGLEALGHNFAQGLGALDSVALDRLSARAQRLHGLGFVRHSELLERLRDLISKFQGQDARFDPMELAQCLGEFQLRVDALLADNIPIPRAFVRGLHIEETFGQRRLIGLGCRAHLRTKTIILESILVDQENGQLQSISQTFDWVIDPETTLSLFNLARRSSWAGRTIASISSGQIVTTHRGKVHEHALGVDQHHLSVYGQSLSWEALPARVRTSRVSQIRARLLNKAPGPLGLNALQENFLVLETDSIRNLEFDSRNQVLVFEALDTDGQSIRVEHPYTSLGAESFEQTMNVLSRNAQRVRFIAGLISARSGSLFLQPTGIVWETEENERRLLIPWIEMPQAQDTLESNTKPDSKTNQVESLLRWLGDGLLAGALDPRTQAEFAKTLKGTGLETASRWMERELNLEDWQVVFRLAAILTLYSSSSEA